MIEGTAYWQQFGLAPPAAVLAATREYLDSRGRARQLAGGVHGARDRRTSKAGSCCFRHGRISAKRTGEDSGTRKQFVHVLDNRDGLWPHKKDGIRGYRGIRITWGQSSEEER